MIDPDDVRKAITPQTLLISIMHANNEVGTLQPITEISRIARAHGVLMHTDAAQSVGKIPTLVDELGVDFLSIAGHKVYAPKGIGVLYMRAGCPLEPLIHGAGHEAGRRAGTENVIFAVGLGKACEVAQADLPRYQREVRQFRDLFWQEIEKRFGDRVVLNGHPEQRLPNTLHVNFRGVIGAELLEKMPTLAASTGSACHAGEISLSSVLEAMHIPPELGMGAVRFSLGRYTTRQEIEQAIARSEELQNQLWLQATASREKASTPAFAVQFIQSLNDIITLHTRRVTAGLEFRIPNIIWIVLYAITALAAASVGYHSGLTGRNRPLVALALILAFSTVIYLIVDLDRPLHGLLQVIKRTLQPGDVPRYLTRRRCEVLHRLVDLLEVAGRDGGHRATEALKREDERRDDGDQSADDAR